MRFGSFVFSISGDRENDHLVIDSTLREVELAEEIGMDAVWLTEHHFDGAVAYADPLVSVRQLPPELRGYASDLPWWKWHCTTQCAWRFKRRCWIT